MKLEFYDLICLETDNTNQLMSQLGEKFMIRTQCWTRGVHPPKSMMHIAYSPYFNKIYKFPPLFPLKMFQFFPYLSSIYVFFLNLPFLLAPYFDHDAFMHHALHVLDASVSWTAPALKMTLLNNYFAIVKMNLLIFSEFVDLVFNEYVLIQDVSCGHCFYCSN